jgi:hypothetical protein
MVVLYRIVCVWLCCCGPSWLDGAATCSCCVHTHTCCMLVVSCNARHAQQHLTRARMVVLHAHPPGALVPILVRRSSLEFIHSPSGSSGGPVSTHGLPTRYVQGAVVGFHGRFVRLFVRSCVQATRTHTHVRMQAQHRERGVCLCVRVRMVGRSSPCPSGSRSDCHSVSSLPVRAWYSVFISCWYY